MALAFASLSPQALAAQDDPSLPDLRAYGPRPHPAQQPECTWTPERLPLASRVVDEDGLLTALADVEGFADPGSRRILSVSFDSLGGVRRLASIESTFPPAAEPAPLDAFLPRLYFESKRVGRLRVGAFGGPEPRVVIGPVQECGPILANRATVNRLFASYSRSAGATRGSVELWIFVETSGLSGKVEVAEGRGNAPLEEAAARVIRDVRFLPALMDGVPRAVWVSLPLSVH